MMLLPGACNRDPRKFENPHEFRIDRPNVREHVAFGRGSHSCPGAPLARAEGRISLNRILDRMADIRISEAVARPARRAPLRRTNPTFIMRGLTELHLEFTRTIERRQPPDRLASCSWVQPREACRFTTRPASHSHICLRASRPPRS